jgi:hypothetical protein
MSMPGRYGTDVTRVCHFPSSSVSGCYRFATETPSLAPCLATACWRHERFSASELSLLGAEGCPTLAAYGEKRAPIPALCSGSFGYNTP